MRGLLLLAVFSAVSASPCLVCGQLPDPDPEILMQRVRTLSDPGLLGRGNGTDAALAAADTVAAWFAAAGLVRHPELEGWFQDFPLSGDEYRGRSGRNVIGWLPGRGDLADQVILIGAHYDHLGVIDDPDGGPPLLYPGADDNASGVSAMVELARIFGSTAQSQSSGSPRRSLLFAAFAGEEIGLQGARHLAAEFPAGVVPKAMLNLDSIGRLRNSRLYVGGVGSSPGFRELVAAVAAESRLDPQMSAGGWDASDHVAFLEVGVPSLFFFTGPYIEYHTPEDRWELVSAAGMAKVAVTAVGISGRLATDSQPPVFTPVGSDSVPDSRGAQQRRAWLGVIPDFTEDAGGVLLAGVMPDSPAAAAGLRKGDVLVEFAGIAVADLPGLTVQLRRHEAGRIVTVVVVRQGERLSVEVTLKRRPR